MLSDFIAPLIQQNWGRRMRVEQVRQHVSMGFRPRMSDTTNSIISYGKVLKVGCEFERRLV